MQYCETCKQLEAQNRALLEVLVKCDLFAPRVIQIVVPAPQPTDPVDAMRRLAQDVSEMNGIEPRCVGTINAKPDVPNSMGCQR